MSVATVIESGPTRPHPKNGRYWVALLVGGGTQGAQNLTKQLRAAHGILVKHHWDYEREQRRAAIPRDVDVVIGVTSASGHVAENSAKASAERAGVPFVRASHKWVFAQKALAKFGFVADQPPIVEKKSVSLLSLLSFPKAAPATPPPLPPVAAEPEAPAKIVDVPVDVNAGPVTVRELPSRIVIDMPRPSLGIPDTFLGCVALLRAFMEGAGVNAIMISPTEISLGFGAKPAKPVDIYTTTPVAAATPPTETTPPTGDAQNG